MSSEAASSSSQLKAAMPAKKLKVEEEVYEWNDGRSDRDERRTGPSKKNFVQN